ncbi:hypothetical protein MXMO3_01666 [Maritalea myrionectae]|uniref:Uncharacterized protein n=1 Tax=Maritalea myrionectae TaxID=454601 RepID=A0A2R4MDV6_9HYPH|nr:hypothetical protein [Maritalea myrionectae]AVX04192.1 hypothetical protein MXMO3_01666 [Maritalea myrionectae]
MITYQWDGLAMVPMPRLQKECDNTFVVGEYYDLEVKEERSIKSHRQYFAAVREYWLNLPELIEDNFPSDEHLRKWALIKCGYYDERSLVASSKKEAQRIAAFVKPSDDFAIVTVNECVVQVFTAKSQSTKAMGKRVFQESKEAVLGFLEDLVMGQAA